MREAVTISYALSLNLLLYNFHCAYFRFQFGSVVNNLPKTSDVKGTMEYLKTF